MSPNALPRTFRPKWAPRVIYPIAGLLLLVVIVGAISLPGGGAHGYRLADRLGIVLIGVALATLLHRLGSVRLVADADGITVRNPMRRHRFAWAQVVTIGLEQSAPWAVLDLADGTSLNVIAIQGSDGDYAWQQVAELRALLDERS